MSVPLTDRYKLALTGLLATVATSLAFYPALTQKGYVVVGLVVAGLVVAVGLVLRTLRAPAVAVLVAQLVVLAEALLIGFGHHLRFGVVPTQASVHTIHVLLTSGTRVAQDYAAPAPPNAGLLLMVVFYIGLVASLVDFVAVGLHRVTLAGLPLLALYTVPVAVLPDAIPVVCFLPGAAAFIALVMADERERLAHWGRLVARGTRGAPAEGIDTGALSATGRRVAVTALAASVLVPFLVPTISSSMFGGGTGPGLGAGGDHFSFADPMVSLAENLRRPTKVDLLDVSTDSAPQYLRLTVLDTLSPDGWRASPVDFAATIPTEQTLPVPVGLSPSVTRTQHSMSISPTTAYPRDGLWVPVPDGLSYVGLSGFAFVPGDDTVTATDGNALAGVGEYNLLYSQTAPTATQLQSAGVAPSDITSHYTELPNGLPLSVGRLARQATQGAATAYQQALQLQSFFRGGNGFTYSVNAAYGDGYQALAAFLKARQGFCQQYSATMAVMARSLGIPARVVVGFLHPDRRAADGSYVFTSRDAHSWVELYFQGAGWVRFDPTPGVGAPSSAYAPIQQASKGTHVPGPGHLPDSGPTSAAPAVKHHTRHADATQAAAPTQQRLPSRWWLLLPLTVVLLIGPAAARAAVRRQRLRRPLEGAEAAEAAWAELRDHMRDLHLPWVSSMTPRRRAASVCTLLRDDPDAVTALDRLALSVERARYARGLDPGGTPAGDAATVSSALGRSVGRSRRIRGWLWPVSLVSTTRRQLERTRERGRRPLANVPAKA